MTLPIVVLASGAGSNLSAIFAAIEGQHCHARVNAVISDRANAAALARAAERGVATDVVTPRAFASRELWDEALTAAIAQHRPELVVLAGFMRIVGPVMLAAFPGRIINVHPALLPLFPGTNAAADALAAGVRVSGCSVHVVDGGIDTGPIIAQAAVPVLPDDGVEQLHARIQRGEHRLLPAVIDAIARGAILLGPPLQIDSGRFAADGMLVSPAIVSD